jgi:hypothetical protein
MVRRTIQTDRLVSGAKGASALASRGSALFAPIFAAHASVMAPSFDDLKRQCLDMAARTTFEIKDALNPAGAGLQFDFEIAGWSEASGPSGFLCVTTTTEAQRGKAGRSSNSESSGLAPHDAAIKGELDAAFPKGVHPDQFDLMVDGFSVLGIQRKHPVEHALGGFGVQRSVGALAQLTTITPDQIDTKIIRRWPDDAGQRWRSISRDGLHQLA